MEKTSMMGSRVLGSLCGLCLGFPAVEGGKSLVLSQGSCLSQDEALMACCTPLGEIQSSLLGHVPSPPGFPHQHLISFQNLCRDPYPGHPHTPQLCMTLSAKGSWGGLSLWEMPALVPETHIGFPSVWACLSDLFLPGTPSSLSRCRRRYALCPQSRT